MSKINSFWDFEKDKDLETSEYEFPQHNSKNFIDFDFERLLLFNLSETQKGTETLDWDDEKVIEICEDFITQFQLKDINAENIIRICFDFENNIIKYKTREGQEQNIYFINLEDKKDDIIECMNLEVVDMSDVEDRINAMLLVKHYESLNGEERLKFMLNFIKMQRISNEMVEGVKDICDMIEKEQGGHNG